MTHKPQQLLILGAGGHGLVIAEAAQASGWEVVGFRDDVKEPGSRIGDWQVIASLRVSVPAGVFVIAGIGDNPARERICTEMAERGVAFATVIHPLAWVSPSAEIGDGVFVGPMAVVHTEARIGWGSIVNSSAVVEHHNQVGNFSHISPGAALAGSVTVGDRVLVGANASVKPGMSICSDVIVGAGSAVVEAIEKPGTYGGVPAKLLETSESPD